MRAKGIRCEVDHRNEKVGYKIREATVQKIPYMLVVGAKEAADGNVSLRSYHDGDKGVVALDGLIDEIVDEIKTRR